MSQAIEIKAHNKGAKLYSHTFCLVFETTDKLKEVQKKYKQESIDSTVWNGVKIAIVNILYSFNLFMTNGISYLYQLDESISNLRAVG